jgi:hypothetical protein
MLENLVRIDKTNSKRAVIMKTGKIVNSELVEIRDRESEKQMKRTKVL